jgi:hypothetical protein
LKETQSFPAEKLRGMPVKGPCVSQEPIAYLSDGVAIITSARVYSLKATVRRSKKVES